MAKPEAPGRTLGLTRRPEASAIIVTTELELPEQVRWRREGVQEEQPERGIAAGVTEEQLGRKEESQGQ